jgi:hypothetical protein
MGQCMSTAAGGDGAAGQQQHQQQQQQQHQKQGDKGTKAKDRSEDYFDDNDANRANRSIIEGLAGAYKVVKLLGSGGCRPQAAICAPSPYARSLLRRGGAIG